VVGEAVDIGAYELFDRLQITSMLDVGNDQGRFVRIAFDGSSLDVVGAPTPILQYEAFRRIDPLPKRKVAAGSEGQPVSPEARVSRARDAGMVSDAEILSQGWEFAGWVPAHARPTYNMIAPTLADSTDQGTHWSVFFMRAATAQPALYYDSPPDSGYSIDNLAPGPPQNLAAAYEAAGVDLDWDDAPEEDFEIYRVYRSTAGPDFVPSPADLITETAASDWTDTTTNPWGFYYKVSTVDHAGNEGPPGSVEVVTATSPRGEPRRFALHDPAPNPFNPSTTLSFELGAQAHVRLSIFDLAGRMVDTLVDEVRGAGRHEVVWGGRDFHGRPVASGVYLCRIEAGAFVETRRLALLK
jgi:hypothetical protein